MINLISDTVTKPTPQMLNFMMQAEVGDDVFHEDPSVNHLESKVAEMFGKEAAIFCPSGTMTNQIAIKMHTQPMDEVICDINSHIYQYETGGYAYNSGVGIKLIEGKNGKITPEMLLHKVNQDYEWLPRTRLVVLENTNNKAGGTFYRLREAKKIGAFCREHGLKLHLDGARLFNALVETQEKTESWGPVFDSISICMSKGLGAPVGSLLIGNHEDIKMARRYRKVMGGGMRQVGYLAAACTYALDNHVSRLKEDNDRAKDVAAVLKKAKYIGKIRPVQTNIIIFDLKGGRTADWFLEILRKKKINASAFGPQTVRFTFHLDVSKRDISRLKRVLKNENLFKI